jgi:hypothetical protein
MPLGRTQPSEPPPRELSERAAENLSFIRSAMERAGPFTAVPGLGQVVTGVTAIAAAALASRRTTEGGWIAIWLAEAVLAVTISAVAIALKSRAEGIPVFAPPARRFAVGFLPPLFAGAALTLTLWAVGASGRLPGLWLLLFGTAVTTGGAFSIRIVRVMGLSFMALGGAALVAPERWGNLFMAAGFGGLLVGYGLVIAWRHGG